jgi:hypothetical protein
VLKPDSLRTWLRRCVPALTADAHRLHVYVEQGTVRALPGSLSYEQSYRLILSLEDWGRPVSEVLVPLLAWIERNQPSLQRVDGPAFAYEADVLDNDLVDLEIRIDLTERVVVKALAGGGWEVQVLAEPEPDPDLADGARLWQLFADGAPLAWAQGAPPPDLPPAGFDGT